MLAVSGLSAGILAESSMTPWKPEFHLDIFLLFLGIAVGYLVGIRRLAPRFAPDAAHPWTALQRFSFVSGMGAMWIAVGWPIHEAAERYLYSAHMIQHLMLAFVVAPLLLAATPGWFMRAVLGRGVLYSAAKFVSRPLPAFLISTVVMASIHLPFLVSDMQQIDTFHAFMHGVMLLSGLIMWMPVLSPMPEFPRVSPLLRCLYLLGQSLLPTVPASFLTFSNAPIYSWYEKLPRLWGIQVLNDQLVAGLIMKLGGGIFLWIAIVVIFFRWHGESDRIARGAPMRWEEIEDELNDMGLART
ncbi:MAG: cytochrome c oxidase assembly protein [Actinobacteria bacterium]|nr:cytochrome c oxidase assembly protein [Actinomycetota bacterium]MCB9388473.1 cytochrome c oxidase assembly protein [Acidimicrobiia bacterium]